MTQATASTRATTATAIPATTATVKTTVTPAATHVVVTTFLAERIIVATEHAKRNAITHSAEALAGKTVSTR